MDPFKLCCDLVDDETSLANDSTQRRSARSQTHTMLRAVCLAVRPEAFQLCTYVPPS